MPRTTQSRVRSPQMSTCRRLRSTLNEKKLCERKNKKSDTCVQTPKKNVSKHQFISGYDWCTQADTQLEHFGALHRRPPGFKETKSFKPRTPVQKTCSCLRVPSLAYLKPDFRRDAGHFPASCRHVKGGVVADVESGHREPQLSGSSRHVTTYRHYVTCDKTFFKQLVQNTTCSLAARRN